MGNKKRYFANATSSVSAKDRPAPVNDFDQENISDSELLGEAEQFHRADSKFAKSRNPDIKFVDGDDGTSESEEEVLGLDLNDDDDDDAELTDEGDDDDERVDASDARDEYWGKHASSYYNTDYVGKDSGDLNDEDIEIAEREQEEASLLQGKLAQQFEAGFAQYQQLIAQDQQQSQQQKTGDFLTSGEFSLGEASLITSDVSKLNEEEKAALLQRRLPGYEEIFTDLEQRFKELTEWLLPSFQLFNNPQVPFSGYGKQYIACKYKLCMSFCRYAVMCVALYDEGESIAGHPVLDRIAETRTLLKMMDKAAGKFSEEMKILRGFISGADQLNQAQRQLRKTDAGKSLLVISRKKLRGESASNPLETDESVEKQQNVKLMGAEADEMEAEEADEKAGAENAENAAADEDAEDDPNKRPITYQIAKNKGLTPYRKKEYRNSRIRHKHKFKRAQVRRKGQVKQYRPQTTKYGGEIGGIKAHISKSVKF